MRMYDIIEKKRNGQALSEKEIHFFIDEYTADRIPDYQISALLMAIYFQGMTNEEQALLTKAMVQSGKTIDLSKIKGIKVDKHSTGGVGDTTTLILAPLVASLDIPVAKMSGRGLGHTGGTIDKLEAIPGFRVELSQDRFIELVNEYQLSIISQTENLAPADKKLYSLRDVTATVDSIPLIASSIMSKKIASGADAIVLDVKTGNGAFMKDIEQAKKLAEAMVAIGHLNNRQTIAIITDMNQPLGFAIGNALEVKEAIATLKGEGPKDLTELCLSLGSYMVHLADSSLTLTETRKQLTKNLHNGKAFEKFKQFVRIQGGDPKVIENPELLPRANHIIDVVSERSGYIQAIDANELGKVALLLGAGRTTQKSTIDLSVGIVLHKKIGDAVKKGEIIATIHANRAEDVEVAQQKILSTIRISQDKIQPPKLIYETIVYPSS